MRIRKRGGGGDDSPEVARYKKAADDALKLLEWCIGYLTHNGQPDLAKRFTRNRDHIRSRLED
jgi:hypothetical protein